MRQCSAREEEEEGEIADYWANAMPRAAAAWRRRGTQVQGFPGIVPLGFRVVKGVP